MSFKDVGSGAGYTAAAAQPKPASPVVRAAMSADPALNQLTESLRNYEQNVNLLRTQLSSSRRMAGNEGREMLMAQLRVLSDLEQRTHQQIEEQNRVLDSLPRSDAASKRVIVSKLSKDFDRLKQAHQSLVQQVASMAQAQIEQMEREQHIEGQLKVQMQARAIEEEILREREQDILRINRDLRLINEMYKDLAAVVTQQQESVNEIAKTTEAAHAKAEEGLQQVQKAAELQTVCTIS